MSNNQSWLFQAPTGDQHGPYNEAQLLEFATNGTISPETMVWTSTLSEWIPAGNVEGLFVPQSPAPATGAAAPPYRPVSIAAHQQSLAAMAVDQSFATAAWGLRTLRWGILIWFLASLALEVHATFIREGFAAPPAWLGAVGLAVIGGFLLQILGISLCFRAPQDSAARGLLIGALCCMLIPLLSAFIDRLILLTLLPEFLMLLVMALVTLYMKRTAALIGNRTLELRNWSLARFLFILIGMILVGAVLVAFILGALTSGNAGVAVTGLLGGGILLSLGMLVFFVSFVVAMCLYLRMLHDTRSALIFARQLNKGSLPTSPDIALK